MVDLCIILYAGIKNPPLEAAGPWTVFFCGTHTCPLMVNSFLLVLTFSPIQQNVIFRPYRTFSFHARCL